ncbi:MAG: hypothetical protein IPI97_08465 [Nitrosomonas sp.]|nr:hypothetical protein [Nitrosomonas sp.]MBK7365018.1 hypothetical protein [Nitrosomonas sp.]
MNGLDFADIAVFSSLGLFIAPLLVFWVGRYVVGIRWLPESENEHVSSGLLDAAIFGLLGLLIAFTFSGTALRFDERRELVVHETNAIETAYLRLNLLSTETQPELRTLLRQYLDARSEVYRRYI